LYQWAYFNSYFSKNEANTGRHVARDTECMWMLTKLVHADDVLMHSKQSHRRKGNAILETPSSHKILWKWSAPNPIRLTGTILKIVA
jgi:hypothetical protein